MSSWLRVTSWLVALCVIGDIVFVGGASQSKQISTRRILSEWKDITAAGLTFESPFNNSVNECGIRLAPLGSNMLEWHFSFLGMQFSNFQEGVYHGRIILHPEYPQKAPVISMLTPSGRWETNANICLSATAHHQETWNSNWNLRTLVLSLRAFMLSHGTELGAITSNAIMQRQLALSSRTWICDTCGVSHAKLLSPSTILPHSTQTEHQAFNRNSNVLSRKTFRKKRKLTKQPSKTRWMQLRVTCLKLATPIILWASISLLSSLFFGSVL